MPRPQLAPARTRPVAGATVVPLHRTGTEQELVVGLVGHQPAAVAELFDRYGSLVRRILIRTLGGAHDVDDLIQETILVIMRRIATLEKPDALRSFIVSVSMRTAKNELRKRAVRRWIGLDDTPQLPVVPPHDPVASERARRIYSALERLDVESRVLFVLRHVEQLELTELARASGCSLATVKRRLARAEKRLEAIVRNDAALCSLVGGPE